MRDAKLIFGKLQPATKATRVYSADVIDLGVEKQNLGDVKNLYACFQLSKAITSGDNFTCEIHDSADNATYALAVAGAAVASGAVGDIIKVPVPKTVKRYLKAAVMPASTGTLTAQDINAWLEFC
jgi:hypothetical protein